MFLRKNLAIASLIVLTLVVLVGVALAVSPVVVEHETAACGETTVSATGATLGNMYLVVSANGATQYANVPTSGSVDLTVGPFFADTVISWNIFGGGERSYDQPLWNGFGTATFTDDINAYYVEQGSFSWVLDGPENPNPFTNFYEIPVQGCTADQYCKDGAWEAHGFKNQGQCVRFVNTGKDSRDS